MYEMQVKKTLTNTCSERNAQFVIFK